ncbi:hypothetical protein FQN57_005378 [Myotisia sp. PD_48]|nr:hypothetical protein FQN57_005378 [Myotisia sp. PD_48]
MVRPKRSVAISASRGSVHKKRGRARSAGTKHDSSNSEGLPSERSSPSEDVDVSDEEQTELEDARKALKGLQNVMEREHKKDTFAKEMEQKVKVEEKRLRSRVKEEHEKWKAQEEQFYTQFRSIATEAQAHIGTSLSKDRTSSDTKGLGLPITSPGGNLDVEKHPLYLKTRNLFESTRELLTGLDNISSHISSASLPPDPTMELEADIEEARRIISDGSEATASKIERLLVYEPSNHRYGGLRKKSAEQKRREALDHDENLQAMFKMGRAALDGQEDDLEVQGWGFVAHQMQIGMEAFLEGLPCDMAR